MICVLVEVELNIRNVVEDDFVKTHSQKIPFLIK